MTALAISKSEIAAEISSAVVAGRAGLRARVAEMLGRCGGTHLPRLRRAGGQSVAVSARESLAGAVFGVTESVTKGARVGGCGAIRFLLVTDSAGSHLATRVCFTRWRVTRVAVVVCG